MKGRGLATAWGLLALVVAATVAWLALSDGPEPRAAGPSAVTVELPPFPEPPASPPDPSGEATPETIAAEPATGEPAIADSAAPDPLVDESGRGSVEAPPPDQEGVAAVMEIPGPIEPLPTDDAAVSPTTAEAQPDQFGTEAGLADAPLAPDSPLADQAQPVPAPDSGEAVAEDASPEMKAPAEATTAPPPVAAAPSDGGPSPPARERAAAPPRADTTAGAAEPTSAPAGETTDAEVREDAEAEPPATVEVGTLRPLPGPIPTRLTPPAEPERDPDLTEDSPFGPLPAVAPDGRRVWTAYARTLQGAPDVPRIAIVIGNLGLASGVTETAITDLPPEITLSFAPYANDVDRWVAKARAAGHEVLLDLPMEPMDYPKHDPGPKALFTHLDREQNRERLHWVLSRTTGYVGVTNFMGSRFTTSPEALRPVLEALRDRGLMFLDSRSAARSLATTMASEIRLPRAVNDRFIDAQASRAAIDRRLQELEGIAAKEGAAVGIGYPYPVTIRRVAAWAEKINGRSDLVLAPVSAVVDRQVDR